MLLDRWCRLLRSYPLRSCVNPGDDGIIIKIISSVNRSFAWVAVNVDWFIFIPAALAAVEALRLARRRWLP